MSIRMIQQAMDLLYQDAMRPNASIAFKMWTILQLLRLKDLKKELERGMR